MSVTAGSRLLSVEEARDGALAAVREPVGVEVVAVADGLARVLAEPVVAATALPPWDNSAMDGYAIRADDTAGAREDAPVRLTVDGDIRAGAAPDREVRPGHAVRIATGAPVPPGADAVVPVEHTTPLGRDGQPGARGRDASGPLPAGCLIHSPVSVGTSIRRAGSDVAAGSQLLEPGIQLTPAAIALAAGSGVAELVVHRRVRVAVMATGDEVREPGEALGAAGIPDANGPGLRALATAAGAEVVDLGVARDELDDVLERLRRGISEADVIIVSGGVSVGPYDVVKAAFEAVGRIDLWRVAVQPGKPFAFGTAARPGAGDAGDRGVLLFGLPGNPVSSFVTFELFVRPALRRLAGLRDILRPVDRAVLVDPVSKSSGRRAFVRVVAERDAGGGPVRDDAGRVFVRLAGGAGGQGSHVMSALAVADGLAVIPETDDSLPAGSAVDLLWLDAA